MNARSTSVKYIFHSFIFHFSFYCKWTIEVLEERLLGVFITEDSLVKGNAPVDAEGGVAELDTTVSLRMIELVALILEDSLI